MQEVLEEGGKRIQNIFHRCIILNGRVRIGEGSDR
jgi:hypothetical protein